MSDEAVDRAKATLEALGYVVIKRTSYRNAQERQRVAEARLACEIENSEGTRRWAHRAFDEQRRLGDRLNFVYGVAMAHGATRDELAGSTGFLEDDDE